VDRMSALVTSLLTLSTLDDGPAPIASGQELAAALTDASITGDPEGDYGLTGIDLERIVENLARNSRAAGAARVEVTARFDDRGLQLRVADDGRGMDEDFVPHAFDRFAREDASRARGEGAGLGLSIVAAIVERAGGTVELDNRPGAGLTVTVNLPAL
jgi:two-component system, OmpR family, sensor kinase